jgi:hypothetical protein
MAVTGCNSVRSAHTAMTAVWCMKFGMGPLPACSLRRLLYMCIAWFSFTLTITLLLLFMLCCVQVKGNHADSSMLPLPPSAALVACWCNQRSEGRKAGSAQCTFWSKWVVWAAEGMLKSVASNRLCTGTCLHVAAG